MLPKLFVTGTMRTGGSLLQNILSAHPKILLLSERVHFFRFVYERYNPLNKESLDYLLNEPSMYINLYFKRLLSFYFLDLNSSQKNYYNFLHIFPNLLISFFSIFGIIVYKKNNY